MAHRLIDDAARTKKIFPWTGNADPKVKNFENILVSVPYCKENRLLIR